MAPPPRSRSFKARRRLLAAFCASCGSTFESSRRSCLSERGARVHGRSSALAIPRRVILMRGLVTWSAIFGNCASKG
eukprot:13801553-Alexandrium_andersonii.AAC.1